jgi:LAGLIDADG endonuclease
MATPTNDGFFHWLAGFIDGEGCFFIGQRPELEYRSAVFCSFIIGLRGDDRPILVEIQKRTGIGTLSQHRRNSVNGKVVVEWRVTKKDDCKVLVDLLDQFPLRSKKARDFEIWAEAVYLWHSRKRATRGNGGEGWDEMCDLMTELRNGRAVPETEAVWQ